MRSSVRLVVLVSLALGAGVAVAAPPPAGAVTGFGVDAVSIDPGPFQLSGFGTATAAIAVTMHDPDKVVCRDGEAGGQLGVTLRRTSRHASDRQGRVDLVLWQASGDSDSGTYTGTWRVGSTRSGTWEVERVSWCADDPTTGVHPRGVDPRRTLPPAATTVVGTLVPTVVGRLTPTVVAWGARQWWQLTYRDGSGRPLVGRLILVAAGGDCYGSPTGGLLQQTDALGRIVLRLYRLSETRVSTACAFLTVPVGAAPGLEATTVLRTDVKVGRFERYARVSVSAPATSVPAGRSVTLTGSVFPRRGSVVAQRFMNGRWGAGSLESTVDGAGRYRVRVVALRGSWQVRVVARFHSNGLAPTASRVFVVRGT